MKQRFIYLGALNVICWMTSGFHGAATIFGLLEPGYSLALTLQTWAVYWMAKTTSFSGSVEYPHEHD